MIGDKHYTIQFKQDAEIDMAELERYIIEDCSAPLTAMHKFDDLNERLNWLEKFAELPAIDFNLSYKYGIIVRTIPYGKKMTILYTVEEDIVYILRVMPQSMIVY